MASRQNTVGFIGLGTMGAAMATHLLRCGFSLAVFDINPKSMAPFAAQDNCQIAVSPGDVVEKSARTITMLPTSDVVEQTLFGADGMAASITAGDLVIEMSTGRLDQLESQSRRIIERGATFVDAPVCLSKHDAARGELIAVVGGSEAGFTQAKDILEALSQRVIHAGSVGFGLRLKLLNNYMSMINHVLTGEVLALAQSIGLDRGVSVDLLQSTAAGKGQLLTNFPKKVLNGDVTADFPITMGIKDLAMAAEMFDKFGSQARFGSVAQSIFHDAEKAGYGDQDCTAVLNFLDAKLNKPNCDN